MAVYIALLRGINVGGKNKMKMADWKQALDSLGCERVQTYIQSGNAVFESSEKEEELKSRIENQMRKDFGLSIQAVLRKASDLERIIQYCPFSEQEIADAESTAVGESLYVAMMAQAPDKEKTEAFTTIRYEGDRYKFAGRDVYLLFHTSIRNSKLASDLRKLGAPATVRNWNTLRKLNEMAKAIRS